MALFAAVSATKLTFKTQGQRRGQAAGAPLLPPTQAVRRPSAAPSTPAWKDELGAMLPRDKPALAESLATELSTLARELGAFLPVSRLLAASERVPQSPAGRGSPQAPSTRAREAGRLVAKPDKAVVGADHTTSEPPCAPARGDVEYAADAVRPSSSSSPSAHERSSCRALSATEREAYLQAASHFASAARHFAARPPHEDCAPSERGRRTRTRLRDAEADVSAAIEVAPSRHPELLEFRSLVRERQREFSAALEDAHSAAKAADLRGEPAGGHVRASTLLREARALSGLGELGKGCNAFMSALDRLPDDAKLPREFRAMLPHVQRARPFPNLGRRQREERILAAPYE
jgi:hypothetical protein